MLADYLPLIGLFTPFTPTHYLPPAQMQKPQRAAVLIAPTKRQVNNYLSSDSTCSGLAFACANIAVAACCNT